MDESMKISPISVSVHSFLCFLCRRFLMGVQFFSREFGYIRHFSLAATQCYNFINMGKRAALWLLPAVFVIVFVCVAWHFTMQNLRFIFQRMCASVCTLEIYARHCDGWKRWKISKKNTHTHTYTTGYSYPLWNVKCVCTHSTAAVYPIFMIVLWRQKASACVFATLFLEHTSNAIFLLLSCAFCLCSPLSSLPSKFILHLHGFSVFFHFVPHCIALLSLLCRDASRWRQRLRQQRHKKRTHCRE